MQQLHPAMARPRRGWAVAAPLAGLALLTACAGGGLATSSTGGATGGPPAYPAAGTTTSGQPVSPGAAAATVTAARTSLGTVLTDGHGRTLYLFKRDTGRSSSCYGGCAEVWPPVTTTSQPRATAPAQLTLLGSTRRHDGGEQLTYDGHPLYYYAGDNRPGDVKGQGLDSFGAGWYVLSPAGHELDNG